MAKEIERKYLVTDDSYRSMATECRHIKQGYLSREVEATVRVRIVDGRGYLTVKGKNRGATRDEWEYEIAAEDAEQMLARCCKGTVIVKNRYIVEHDGYDWEIDEYINPAGIPTVAEIELVSEEDRPALPGFVGTEVTGNPSYYNSNL